MQIGNQQTHLSTFQGSVIPQMVSVSFKKIQILWPIVRRDAVNMMDKLVLSKRSPQKPFGDDNMLPLVPIVFSQIDIPPLSLSLEHSPSLPIPRSRATQRFLKKVFAVFGTKLSPSAFYAEWEGFNVLMASLALCNNHKAELSLNAGLKSI